MKDTMFMQLAIQRNLKNTQLINALAESHKTTRKLYTISSGCILHGEKEQISKHGKTRFDVNLTYDLIFSKS